jgi:uncharacterized lipoprotein NlpE involved in copper resistance
MKKIFLMLAAVVALSLMSCDGNYKAKGEEYAKQLDELCQKQDADAVLALDKTINEQEQSIAAMGDSAAIADFRGALKDARERNAAYITSIKLKKGINKDSVLNEVVGDVMQGEMGIDAVTNSVDATLENKKK